MLEELIMVQSDGCFVRAQEAYRPALFELRHLRYFIAAADHGTFRKAALALARIGVPIERPGGPMTFAPIKTGAREIIAFLKDPDGYPIELVKQRRA